MNAGPWPAPRIDRRAIDALIDADPDLAQLAGPLGEAAEHLVRALAGGGTVYLAGNGGSLADALHIAGELRKAFERPRPLPVDLQERLGALAGGAVLAGQLQAGLRAQVLGADPVLASAVDNDLGGAHLQFAQDLVASARAGDALVVLSTSGRSPSVVNAAVVARGLDLSVVLLTGSAPAATLAALCDVVISVPDTATAAVQSRHSLVYHALCRVLEDTFFPQA